MQSPPPENASRFRFRAATALLSLIAPQPHKGEVGDEITRAGDRLWRALIYTNGLNS
jgi:hypothetical protein